VRGHAADRARLAGELQVTQVAVRRADVRDEDGVVEVEDERDAGGGYAPLEEGGAEQRGLAQDVDGVEVAEVAQLPRAARERAGDERGLPRQLPRLVDHRAQLLVLERAESHPDAEAREQRLPLLDAVTLARVRVGDARDYRKQTHKATGGRARNVKPKTNR
jgi:hypothetical protein